MPSDESLFAGAAPYYARYRAPYPPELIADIVTHYGLDGQGRLLDLGCGPGTLTLPLAQYFESVVALDVDESMVEEGRRIAASFSQFRDEDVAWRVMRAEEISPELGTFRLVTCGSSFHWMDRDVVLAQVKEMLEPRSGIALAAGIRPWWDGPEDWHQAITAAVKRYLGDRRRAGATAFKEAGELFEQTLERNGWRVELNRDYPSQHQWDVDSVIGHLWSTSFANRSLLGDHAGQFEAELREELLRLHPDEVFKETGLFGLVCGRPG